MDAEDAGDHGGEENTSNADLFRELKRLLPTAIFDDYYKHGTWKRDHLLVDLELVQAHRSLAGAPEPPPVDDIPELEAVERLQASKPRSPPRGGRPTSGAASRLTPTQPSMPPPRKVVDNAHEDELRRIRLFIEKWRLDPRRAREAMLPLKPAQQLWVMRSYRHTSKVVGPTSQLEQFIRDSQHKGDLPSGGPADRSAAAGHGVYQADRGMKRSLSGSARGSTTSPRLKETGVSSARARLPVRPRTPPRSSPRPGPRPISRDQRHVAATASTAPRPPPSRAPSAAVSTGNGAKNGVDSRGRAARPSDAPKPSSATSKPVAASASAPARSETKKVPKAESKPGDLIKNLLF